ncbi:MAG: transglutaminase N-terminal domain-containing protein [Sphingomonas sp.]
MTRLRIDHRTIFRPPASQGRLIQLLRMTPDDTHDQSIARWDVHPDCDARMRAGRDGFGNRMTMLYLTAPAREIEIIVTGEVLTAASNGVVRGASEPLPPALFLRRATATDEELAGWARGVTSGATSMLDRLHRVNVAIRREAAGGVPRFLAAARSLSIPARFVSGYSSALDRDADRAVPHAWAEAHVEGLGWVAFDPATGLSADEAYVRVAVALDAVGAAPVAGRTPGSGEGDPPAEQ